MCFPGVRTVADPTDDLHPQQVLIPYDLDFLCHRGWEAESFPFANFVLTKEKENILSWIKSKASLGENPLLFILSCDFCLERQLSTERSSQHANVRLPAWGRRPVREVEGPEVRRSFKSLIVSLCPQPSSTQSTTTRIVTLWNKHTHTILNRGGKKINRNPKIVFLFRLLRVCPRSKHPISEASAE